MNRAKVRLIASNSMYTCRAFSGWTGLVWRYRRSTCTSCEEWNPFFSSDYIGVVPRPDSSAMIPLSCPPPLFLTKDIQDAMR